MPVFPQELSQHERNQFVGFVPRSDAEYSLSGRTFGSFIRMIPLTHFLDQVASASIHERFPFFIERVLVPVLFGKPKSGI